MEEKNNNNDIDFENKKCLCCIQSFKLNSDLKRHIKTAKHIKKSTGIDTKHCSFCNYTTENKSDLNKHIKTVHRENKQKIDEEIIKVGNSEIPQTILNQYFMLNQGVNTSYFAMMGKKHRIKLLKNRNFKDDEKEVIEAKKDYKLSIDFYNNNVKSLKLLEEKFSDIVKAIQPKINDEGEAEEDSDNDDKDDIEKTIRNNKLLDLEDLKDELQELYEQLKNRDFNDLQKHKNKISNKEKEIKKIMNELYKK